MKHLNFALCIYTIFFIHVAAPKIASSSTHIKRYEGISEIVGHHGKYETIPYLHQTHYVINIPYHNLNVHVEGFKLTPAMELEFEIIFSPAHNDTLKMMGEICLLEHEVPVIETLLRKLGLTITAVHNHFIKEDNKIIFIHFHGIGHKQNLAIAVKTIQDNVNTLRNTKKLPNKEAHVKNSLDTKFIDNYLNVHGEMINGIYKIEFMRNDLTIIDHEHRLDIESWFTIQGSPAQAALAGEFALLESQVELFTNALLDHGIEIAALHSHMITEKPRLFFIHPWGVGSIQKLLKGIKAALKSINLTQTLSPMF